MITADELKEYITDDLIIKILSNQNEDGDISKDVVLRKFIDTYLSSYGVSNELLNFFMSNEHNFYNLPDKVRQKITVSFPCLLLFFIELS